MVRFAAESGAVAELEIATWLHASGGQVFTGDAQSDNAVEAFGVEAIDQRAQFVMAFSAWNQRVEVGSGQWANGQAEGGGAIADAAASDGVAAKAAAASEKRLRFVG